MSSNPSSGLFGRRRLTALLLSAFVALAVLPALTLTVYSTITEQRREYNRALASMALYSDTGTDAIERWVSQSSGRIESDLTHPEYQPIMITLARGFDLDLTRPEFRAHAQDVVRSRAFDYLLLLDMNGVVQGANDEEHEGLDLSSEVWFAEALSNPDQITVAGPMRDPLTGQDGMFFVGVVQNLDMTEPVGVLVGRTSLAPITDILNSVLPSGVLSANRIEFFLVETGQTYVKEPYLAPDQVQGTATDDIIDIALSGADGGSQWTDYRGQSVIGAYRWIDSLDMSLIVKQDAAAALSDVSQRVYINIGLGFLIGIIALGIGVFMTRLITQPLTALSQTAERISKGDLTATAPSTSLAEIEQVGSSLNHMTTRLRTLLESQEETIKSRTRQLQMTAQIGRSIAAETDLERLLDITITRIRDQLGHYHVQIFLLDDLRQYAVLRASTGEAGQQLLDRNHKLPVGSRSVIGQATTTGEPVLAGDTLQAEYWMPNPLLPNTRAELAVPIQVADQIMGALDVQSIEPDAFDEQTVASLQTIADQLAVALRNAQLFEEKEGLISASVQLTQMLTRESWDSYLTEHRSQQQVGFSYDLSGVTPLGDGGNGSGNGHSEQAVTMPIALRGEMIGELETQLPENQVLTDDERNLVGQVLDRVALALENARLFEQTQASLQESNRLYQASRKISTADSIPGLAQALVELAVIESVDRVALFLLDNPDDPIENRWAEIVGLWHRDPDDAVVKAMSRRMNTNQPPLETVEQVEANGVVLNNIETAKMKRAVREMHTQMGVKSLGIFPLITGRRTIGWLILHATRQNNAFTEATTRFYRTLADQAATALESLRLLEQTQVRARRLQATNEVSRAASSILDPDLLLPMVVDRISEAFGYYHAQIFMIDERGQYAALRASTGAVGQKLLSRDHKLEIGSQSVIGRVTSTGEPVIVKDTATDPTHKPNELLPDTRSEMAIPLKTGDRVIGALDVQSTQPNAFDPEAQQILQSLAGEMAVTMENAVLFQEIQERVGELTTINLVSQAVSRTNTLQELYEVVARELTKTFGARNAYLAIFDAESQMIHLPLFIEQGEFVEVPSRPLGAGITSHVIQTRRVLMLNENVSEEAAKLGARTIGNPALSLLAVPLLIGEEVVGVISIQDQERENAYNEAHVRQLTTLAAYIAVKIRNAELLQEAHRRAGELGFLFNVTRAAVATSDLDQSLSNVADILSREIKSAEAVIIYLASSSGEKLEPHAAVGWAKEIAARGPIDWGQGMVGYGATLAQPMIISDAQSDERFRALDQRIRGAMMVPLMTGNGLIGVLAVESSVVDSFSDNDLRLLETASGTLTAIIQNARLLEEVARANEELQELDRLKSQFLAAMSHELRTPLNSIIGFSRVMLKGIDGPLNDLQTQDLNTIYNSGNHLLGLINDILDLSKIEAKMMEIQPEYTSMTDIIDGVMSTAKGLNKDKPIDLYIEVDPGLPMVWGDPQRLRQVLLNLVSNGSKFTKEGSLTVRARRLEYDPVSGDPPRVQVDVIDTGIGIPEDKLDKVFEAFQQVDGSTTREYGGTGLGLPISRNFIHLHGGEMWVTSEVGKGSTFSFWVPLHPQTAEGSEVIYRQEGDSRPLVLAVDDEQGVIDLYTRYLEKEGYAVIGLSHANDIVQHVRELQPLAVLMDINLPGKDGWLAINDLKQTIDTQNVPIIVSSIDVDHDRATSAGVSEVLIKPIIEGDLLGAIHRIIEGTPRALRSVLVIDAYPDHAQYIRDSLESTGYYSVKVVGQGFEGLAATQEANQPEVVVIDVDLPDMDGVGLLAAMRSHPSTKHIPVVILTAREVTPEDLAKLGPWDITGYLSKYDYDGYRLAEKVAEVMTKAPGVASN